MKERNGHLKRFSGTFHEILFRPVVYKTVRLAILLLINLVTVQPLLSSTTLGFRPGIILYSDGFGMNAGLGFNTDVQSFIPGFPAGFMAGADVQFSWTGTALSNLSMMNIHAAAEIGYDVLKGIFHEKNGYALTPYCKTGLGLNTLGNQYTNAVRFGFLLTPGLRFEIPLGSRFLAGLDFGYRMLFFDLLTNSFSIQNAVISVSMTFLLNAPETKITGETTVKKRLKRNEIQKLETPEIVRLAREARDSNAVDYARELVKEGLLKEPDNTELLTLFSELMKY